MRQLFPSFVNSSIRPFPYFHIPTLLPRPWATPQSQQNDPSFERDFPAADRALLNGEAVSRPLYKKSSAGDFPNPGKTNLRLNAISQRPTEPFFVPTKDNKGP